MRAHLPLATQQSKDNWKEFFGPCCNGVKKWGDGKGHTAHRKFSEIKVYVCSCCKKILTPSREDLSKMDARTRKLVEQMMKVQSMQSRP